MQSNILVHRQTILSAKQDFPKTFLMEQSYDFKKHWIGKVAFPSNSSPQSNKALLHHLK